MTPLPVVISCEHAGHQLPAAYHPLFKEDPEVLFTHQGWDIGALGIARYLGMVLHTSVHFEKTSRLLIEMNRSMDNPGLFSRYSQPLPASEKDFLISNIYIPYRKTVISALENIMQTSSMPVLHFSVHTFTPVLGEEVRTTDIGILFDPARFSEVVFCETMQTYLAENLPEFQIDFNMPYQGTEDGFTTFLRKKFSSDQYCGVEIEVNQKHVSSKKMSVIKRHLSEAIRIFYEQKN